ncbi:MAG: caspase family protein [Bacteroidia bacterium]|nr:caspase family protein [Bacteroidia bacterium]
MKRHLIISILLLSNQLIWSQERGITSISIKVDSTTIELYKESHALLIGVSKYINDWPDLPGVKKDMQLLQPALEKQGFNVVLVEDPTKAELEKAIVDFISKYGQENQNRLLIYFAGHGHTITTNYGEELGYIIPSDAPNPNVDLAGFKSIAMPISQIEIYAKQIDSKHALFLFDACFSGSLFTMTRAIPDAISYKTTNPVRQFITSGSANEKVSDESIFRQQFITAITTDYADANKDGYLTGSELGEYLQTNVTNYSYNSQHPQYGKIRNPNLDKGDFVFILPNSLKNENISILTVPKIFRTKEINNYLFHGLYLQMNLGFASTGYNFKTSLFYSSKFLNNRYCFGLEVNFIKADYIQKIETFPNLYQTSDSSYSYKSIGLYNRLYLFPQNQSIVNLYLGASISWNDWQLEMGLRPFLTKKIMLELQANYLMHYGKIQNIKFSPFGNSEKIEGMNLFKNIYFGFNIVYFISFL